MDCIQFLLPLRGKYRTEWPFRWQETQDGGGGNTWQNIYFAKENSNTQKTVVLFYFSMAVSTSM